jgi:hypothetical protein
LVGLGDVVMKTRLDALDKLRSGGDRLSQQGE